MNSPRRCKILIVGAGFAGLAAAIRLKESGENDFILLERSSDVGGVWRENRYPGSACDVRSHLFSYSFALNPEWSQYHASQAEIHNYLKNCVHKYDLHSHILFSQEVTSLSWQESRGEWSAVTVSDQFTAKFVIGAMGMLSEPELPFVMGLDSFKGLSFHSSAWPKGLSLKGQRVAVVGAGASAIQMIPLIQPEVDKLVVFQRTPAWVLPRVDYRISAFSKRFLKLFPVFHHFLRLKTYLQQEWTFLGFQHPNLMQAAQAQALDYLHSSIPDSRLRKKLTPAYTLGCKRILLSNDYFKALTASNVDVFVEELTEVKPEGVVKTDGVVHPVDIIVFATGFQTQVPPYGNKIFGSKGDSLTERWQGSPEAYLGTMISGFPNLFLMNGPHTGVGHTSLVYILEAQVDYILRTLEYLKNHSFDIFEPSAEAQDKFVQEVRLAMSKTVWAKGQCQSWYQDGKGLNSVLWPKFTFLFKSRLSKMRVEDFSFRRVLVSQKEAL